MSPPRLLGLRLAMTLLWLIAVTGEVKPWNRVGSGCAIRLNYVGLGRGGIMMNDGKGGDAL
jgi:hypothetical protein